MNSLRYIQTDIGKINLMLYEAFLFLKKNNTPQQKTQTNKNRHQQKQKNPKHKQPNNPSLEVSIL